MIHIRLLGGLSVSRVDQRAPAATAMQPRRLAILATIAHAGARGISRERLHSLLWPDATEEVARRGLTQALYALRTGLECEELFLGLQELRLNRDVASCDVLEYQDAIHEGELERAAGLYGGPFLDGFRVHGAADFERRVEEQRDELTRRHESLIERLAARASKQGHADEAVDWWRQRAAMDPLNARVAELYMRALAAAGDRVGAIRYARVHEQLIEQEFGSAAESGITALAEQLRIELNASPITGHVSFVAAATLSPSATAPSDADTRLRQPITQVPAPTVHRRAPAMIWTGVAIALAALPLVIWTMRRTATTAGDANDLSAIRVSAPRRIAAENILELDPAISPDGRDIAFVAGEAGAIRLYVRRREGGQAIPVAESVAGEHRLPRWSPDGSSIVFQAARGIWSVPALGGTPRLVVAPPSAPAVLATSPTWSPDGREIAWVVRDTIYRMPVMGGEARMLATLWEAHSLAWSPDGRWIAAASGNAGFVIGASIGNLAPSALVLIPTGIADSARAAVAHPRLLVPPTTLNVSPAWLDYRTLVFVSTRDGTRDLFATHINDDGTARGDIVRITAGLDAFAVSSSADGQHLAYAVLRQSSSVWSLKIRPDKPTTLADARRVTKGAQVVEGLDVSSDGKWLAFDADAGGQQDIFRLQLQDGVPTSRDAERMVTSTVDDFHPTWSPDAQWLAFYSFRGNVRRAAYIPATGGAVRLVHPSGPDVEEHSPVWSADGRSLIFFRSFRGGTELYRTKRLTDTTWSPSEQLTNSGGMGASFTADGMQATYFSAPGTMRLTDSSYSERASHVILSPARGGGPTASSGRILPDGNGVIVKGDDALGHGFWWYPLRNGKVGAPRLLVRFDNARRSSPRPEFASDGRHIYFTIAEREADVWALQLKRR